MQLKKKQIRKHEHCLHDLEGWQLGVWEICCKCNYIKHHERGGQKHSKKYWESLVPKLVLTDL